MSITPDCYTNIIGITRTECTCYGDISSDYTESNSGLFLDELELLPWVSGLLGCENGSDVFELMYKALIESVIIFKKDAVALMTKKYKVKRQPFKGKIGRLLFDDIVSGLTVGNYTGAMFALNDIKGGILQITNIYTMFDTTGTITLLIYNSLGELVDTLTLDTTANTYEGNTVDITLPMHDDSVDNLEYYFLYQYDGIVKPLNNKFDEDCCTLTCGQLPSQARNQYRWKEFLTASGVSMAALTGFNDACSSTNNNAYGLAFDVKIGCDVSLLFCDGEMDFINDPLALLKADAIRFKAANILISRLLRSNNLNYNTMVNREQLIADQTLTDQKYMELMTYIAENTDINNTDCLTCKIPFEMHKGLIRI